MQRNTLLAIVVLVVLVIVAFLYQPPAQGLAQLPDEGRNLVMILVTAAVTWALLQLSLAVGLDLSGYAAPIAAVLSPILVTIIESYLNLIPPIYDNIVLTIIHLLVLLLGSIGAYVATLRVKERQSKQLLV